MKKCESRRFPKSITYGFMLLGSANNSISYRKIRDNGMRYSETNP